MELKNITVKDSQIGKGVWVYDNSGRNPKFHRIFLKASLTVNNITKVANIVKWLARNIYKMVNVKKIFVRMK